MNTKPKPNSLHDKLIRYDGMLLKVLALFLLANFLLKPPSLVYTCGVTVLWLLSALIAVQYWRLPKGDKSPPQRMSGFCYWHIYCTFFLMTALGVNQIIPRVGVIWKAANLLFGIIFLALVAWTFISGTKHDKTFSRRKKINKDDSTST